MAPNEIYIFMHRVYFCAKANAHSIHAYPIQLAQNEIYIFMHGVYLQNMTSWKLLVNLGLNFVLSQVKANRKKDLQIVII